MIQPKYQLRLQRHETWQMDRPHFHEDVEILLSLSDGGDFFIENELYALRHGALFLLNESTLHKSIANEAYKRYVLHISPETLQGLSTSQSDFVSFTQKASGHCALLQPEQTAALTKRFQQLEHPIPDSFGGDIRRTMALLDFLLEVFSFFSAADVDETGLNSDFARIAPILKYIQNNIAKPLTLDEVSARFFINKYHLCHVFKSATGFSVMEYIIHCRVLRARELLRTGMRVQEVAEAVGFQNTSHFIRTFGSLTGTSPKRYAKEYLSSDKC